MELGNFVSSGIFKPMNASHTCHHKLCIVNVVYEAAHMNHGRKCCFETVRELRRTKKKERSLSTAVNVNLPIGRR